MRAERNRSAPTSLRYSKALGGTARVPHVKGC